MVILIKLKYKNTNTFFIKGQNGGLLVDTDYAGTLYAFYKAIKEQDLKLSDISYVLATHYHPDHMGIISSLMTQGVKLLIVDTQTDFVHYSDNIFKRDNPKYQIIDESAATIISCEESRSFLKSLGIMGTIISTPSHSKDSVSLVLDDGQCFVGDLEPYENIDGYENNEALKDDWSKILALSPQNIYYAHWPERKFHLFNEQFKTLENDDIKLTLIDTYIGNDKELPFYWWNIISKDRNQVVGKISFRIGQNYHSYFNGNIGYEVDELYRGHNYAYIACQLLIKVSQYYHMDYLYLTCKSDNIASIKTIEKLGALLIEERVPPKDYVYYYEHMPKSRIYKMIIK